MQDIDETLGGRIEWPNVHLVDGLVDNHEASGQYRSHFVNGQIDGQTVDPGMNANLAPDERIGILIDKDLVDNEFETGEPRSISIRAVLVHELQHATSSDHDHELKHASSRTQAAVAGVPNEDTLPTLTTGEPPYGGYPVSESRADFAILLERELSERRGLGGPKLNELPDQQRRDAIAGILTDHLEQHGDRARNEAELLGALRDQTYMYDWGADGPANAVWSRGNDGSETALYAYGLSNTEEYVPYEKTTAERANDLRKPITEMADRWSNQEKWQALQKIVDGIYSRTDDVNRLHDKLLAEHGEHAPDNTDIGSRSGETDTPTPMAETTDRSSAGTPAEAGITYHRGPHPAPRTEARPEPTEIPGTASQRYTVETGGDAERTAREMAAIGDIAREHQKKIRHELDTILDSMLVTERIPPGTPFEERVGHVDDPRVLQVMREIDETLGGRIEWPNVYLADEMNDRRAMAQYRAYPDAQGATVPTSVNEHEPDHSRYGITIRRDIVEHEMTTGEPMNTEMMTGSLRAILVHELQHATSNDASHKLLAAAERNQAPYRSPKYPMAEGRADLGMLVEQEMRVRDAHDAPKLNELPKEERRAVLTEILSDYLVQDKSQPQHVKEAVTYLAVRDPAYLGSPKNMMWSRSGDDRTKSYVYGMTGDETFVPSHKTAQERNEDLQTTLPELAERWRTQGSTPGTTPGPAHGRAHTAERTADAKPTAGDGKGVAEARTPGPSPNAASPGTPEARPSGGIANMAANTGTGQSAPADDGRKSPAKAGTSATPASPASRTSRTTAAQGAGQPTHGAASTRDGDGTPKPTTASGTPGEPRQAAHKDRQAAPATPNRARAKAAERQGTGARRPEPTTTRQAADKSASTTAKSPAKAKTAAADARHGPNGQRPRSQPAKTDQKSRTDAARRLAFRTLQAKRRNHAARPDHKTDGEPRSNHGTESPSASRTNGQGRTGSWKPSQQRKPLMRGAGQPTGGTRPPAAADARSTPRRA